MTPGADGGLSGARVLVTGGTGFIGGRTVEKLVLEHGAEVRVLTRSFSHAARVGRFPVEMVRGDVTVPADARRAVAGCDVVVHCAYGSSGSPDERRRVTVDGTDHVLRAAAAEDVDRVVHLSTVEVYDHPQEGEITESSPRARNGNTYADAKLEAERVAFDHASRGVPVAVIQPTVVFGPWAPVWTTDVLRRMREERVPLVDGGEGLCDAVYVDDVVDAVLAAAVLDAAVGEAFLVGAGESRTWAEFYGRFEEMLGETRTVSLAGGDVLDRWEPDGRRGLVGETLEILGRPRVRRRLFSTPEAKLVRKAARTVLPPRVREPLRRKVLGQAGGEGAGDGAADADPVEELSPEMVRFYRRKVRVRTEKARRVLGCEPSFSFARGMELTETWARWAGLLGGAGNGEGPR